MLGKLGRRAIDLAVLFLALYAFAFVPLGQRTGLEHARAILATRAAREAASELAEAAARLRHRLLDVDDAPDPGRAAPRVPKLPRGAPVNAAVAPGPVTVAPAADAPDASL